MKTSPKPAAAPLIREADKANGYEFGCEGLVRLGEARELLGGISDETLSRLVDDGKLRKGKFPGRRFAVICRRSLREYIAELEQ